MSAREGAAVWDLDELKRNGSSDRLGVCQNEIENDDGGDDLPLAHGGRFWLHGLLFSRNYFRHLLSLVPPFSGRVS